MNAIRVTDRDLFHALVPAGAPLERIATGYGFTEGPVWDGADSLYFTDIPRSRIWRWQANSARPVLHRAETGMANGLAFDARGCLIACEGGARRLTAQTPDGSVTTLAERYEGRPLNGPNDVVAGPHGDIYFSDPAFDRVDLGFSGVYRLSASGQLILCDGKLPKPNGVTLSPDCRTLYVSDTDTREIYSYPIGADGNVNGRLTFARLDADAPGYVDGLKTDMQGNVYCTGPGGVWIFTGEGAHLGTILTPEISTNCAWGAPDRQTLFITAGRSVYRVRLNVPGMILPPAHESTKIL